MAELTAIEKLEDMINKEFGQNSIFCPKLKMPIFDVPRISTGNLFLDMDLGGGFTTGKIHLITGPFSSGKTYLALKVAAQFTQRGQRVAFLDAEFTFDPKWAEACGVDMNLLHLIRKQIQEEVIDIIELLVASGEFGLIIIDSLAALIPRSIHEDEADKQHMGKEAKLNNKLFKKLIAQQSEAALEDKIVSTIIVINQWREKVGVMYGSPATLPGGKGQYYFSSTWVDFWADETILDGSDRVIGMHFGYNVKKNKTAPPRRTGKVAMFLENYKGMAKGDWDAFGAIIDVALLSGVFKKSGTWYAGPLLDKNYQFTNLWKKLYTDEDLEKKVVAGIQATMPELKFDYIPPIRKLGVVQNEEPEVVGEEAESDTEGKESKAGKKRGKAV